MAALLNYIIVVPPAAGECICAFNAIHVFYVIFRYSTQPGIGADSSVL